MRENIATLLAAIEAANCDRRTGTTIAIPIDKENMFQIPEYELFTFIDDDETCKKCGKQHCNWITYSHKHCFYYSYNQPEKKKIGIKAMKKRQAHYCYKLYNICSQLCTQANNTNSTRTK